MFLMSYIQQEKSLEDEEVNDEVDDDDPDFDKVCFLF